MDIIKELLTPNRYSRPQTPLKRVSKIAVHYVANPMSSAINNRNYFESLKVGKKNNQGNSTYGSSHYIIGLNGEIIQCVPENEVAYATYDANYYSISIECCHPKSDGKFNDKTEKSLKELCVDLCNRYKLNPLTDIIRHYDVPKSNGWRKPCPLYWVNNPTDFERFKKDVMSYINGEKEEEMAERIFNYTMECPEWSRATVQKLLDKGYLKGDEKGKLGLNETMIKLLVINDRAKVYDK